MLVHLVKPIKNMAKKGSGVKLGLAEPDRIDQITKPDEIKPEVAVLLKELADKNDLDEIILADDLKNIP